MKDFKWINIKINAWSRSDRRIRIGKIFMGLNKVYGKSELLKFSCNESIHPLSASLPKYEIQFEVDNRDGAYNPFNESDDNLAKYMMERQKVKTWYGFKLGGRVERIPGGVYYLTEWSAPQNGKSATFKARDLLGFMDAQYKDEAFEPGSPSRNLRDLALDVLKAASLPGFEDLENEALDGSELWYNNELWYLDSSLSGNLTSSQFPEKCSMAECLELIANAGCCSIFFDRTGKLHIAPLSSNKNALGETAGGMQIHYTKSYTKPETSLSKPIKQVAVSCFGYDPESQKTQERGSPVKYPSDEEFTKPVAERDAEFFKENVLISSEERAAIFGEEVFNYLQRRKNFSIDWRVDPRMDTGDIVEIASNQDDTPWLIPKAETNNEGAVNPKPQIFMRVLSTSLSFNGAFRAKCDGIEIDKPALQNSNDDAHEEETGGEGVSDGAEYGRHGRHLLLTERPKHT
jgi:hypothetical protein